jgi:very-long-chain (3R)-3-hydroxyacyl-CoA dehydratase
MAMLVPLLGPTGHLPAIFNHIFMPLLTATQTLALLEILHSLLGFVRAPIFTTFLQVMSRIVVVWGVMFLFHEGSMFVQPGDGIIGGDYEGLLEGNGTLTAVGPGAKPGDYAFLGCLAAWGITECIRYGYFALQCLGKSVPQWWTWLKSVFPLLFCRFCSLSLSLYTSLFELLLLVPSSFISNPFCSLLCFDQPIEATRDLLFLLQIS